MRAVKHDQNNLFHRCVEDLHKWNTVSTTASYITGVIGRAQRFIVPNAGDMIVGRRISEFSNLLQRLPYPEIALLSFHKPERNGAIYSRIRHITVCSEFAAHGQAQPGFILSSCAQIDSRGWMPVMPPCQVLLTDSEEIGMYSLGEASKEGRNSPFQYLNALVQHEQADLGLSAITELLILLSLSNAGTAHVEPSEALNKKRIASNKLPLYDYHVLTIDGEEVFDRRGNASSGEGVRSHFRRGHIRRLNDDRRVWVRHTVVHGKRPGFVDKEYDLSKLAQKHSERS